MGKHAAPVTGKEPAKVKKYAKFLVALLGFLGTVATAVVSYVTTGAVDVELLVTAGITFLTAIGVYQVPNKAVDR